jgi:flavin reductase (DIM6/NTAB) family NADH-FMN oxidoreductase RutF
MRSLPHSIVIVTTSKLRFDGTQLSSPSKVNVPNPSTPRDYRGMTVSSFTTLTLTPEPIISFNIKFPSQTLAAIEHGRHFLVHLLEASEAGMLVADAFTKGSREKERVLLGNMGGVGVKAVEVATRFHKDGTTSLPMLRNKGVMRVLRCSVLSGVEGKKSGLVKVGDHMLVLAKVEEILEGGDGKEEVEGVEERMKSGLCYADGKYRRIGDVIEVNGDAVEGKKDRDI